MTISLASEDAALRVFLVAGEASGDRLGAALMAEIAALAGRPVRFSGLGGPEMAAAGLPSLFPIDEISIIGVTAVFRAIPRLLRRIRETADAVVATRPDILVIIDSPDFTHRVARRVRAQAPSIPILDYVAPTVWGWRPGRARVMRAYVDHVLALLPFEPASFTELDGPPCTYVGHPLAQQAQSLRPDAVEEQRRRAAPPVILALPGSRRVEIRRMAALFGEALALAATRCGALDVVVPTVPGILPMVREATDAWPIRPRIVVDPAEKRAAFRVARAALAKSGTNTLELAIAGVPMVTAYKVSSVEAVFAPLVVRGRTIILANLVLGENVVPEYFQRAATPRALANALSSVIADTPERQRQVDAFARLDAIMEIGRAEPSRRAAEIVLRYAASGR